MEDDDPRLCEGKGCLHCLNCLYGPAMRFTKWFGVSGVIHEKNGKPPFRFNPKFERYYERFGIVVLWLAFWEWFYRMMTLPSVMSGEANWLQSYTVLASSYLQAALSATVYNIVGPRVQMLTELRMYWNKTRIGNFGVKDEKKTEKRIARYQKITCFFNYPVVVIGVMITESYIYYQRALRYYMGPRHMFFLVLQIICLYFAYTAWLSSAIYFIAICKGVSRRFEEITNRLQYLYELQRSNKQADGTFAPMQLKHFISCKMVKSVNRMFQWYIIVTYLVLIPGSCISLYQFTSPDQPSDSRTLLGIHTFLLVMTLLIVSLNAAAVSSSAHRPYEILHGLSLPELDLDLRVKITLFLERLNGPTIGLTCLDFFVVTKGVVLSVFSAIVTYFLIFLQFRSTA